MSVGVFTSPVMLENVTHSIFHGFGAVNNGGIVGAGGANLGYVPTQGKHCTDINDRPIAAGNHFVPGPDECTLCICDDGEPKWCKAVYCAPPQDCKSFRIGHSCCDFICMDDGGPNTGGPYLSRPMEIGNFLPKILLAAVSAMISLSLLFFLIHRLRKRHIQGRLNSARARRSTQMCDECDDTRSLDFSNDFFEHRMNSPNLYPPPYLSWKPPSSYCGPRGEPPPPYHEAMMTTSIGANNIVNTHTSTTANPLALPFVNNNNNLPSNISHNPNVGILSDIPIIVPPPVGPILVPPSVGGIVGARSSPAAIQRLASAIASTTNSGGSTTCCTTANSLALSASPSPQHHIHTRQNPLLHHHHQQTAKVRRNSQGERDGAGKVCQVFKIKSSKSSGSRSKSSKTKERRHIRQATEEGEPQPGTSRIEETDPTVMNNINVTRYSTGDDIGLSPITFRIGPQSQSHHHHHHTLHLHPLSQGQGSAPPPYEDALFTPSIPLHSTSPAYYSQRHSLTLPPREVMSEGHLYPNVIVNGSSGLISGSGAETCLTEEQMLRRTQHNHNQRYSLQFDLGDGGGSSLVLGGRAERNATGEWSSSSSTLSLSTSPNSPVAPSLSSSSSESSIEPPPPAPTSAPPKSSSTSSSNNHNNCGGSGSSNARA